jgi:cobalt-zinc-cadmium efflux system protein
VSTAEDHKGTDAVAEDRDAGLHRHAPGLGGHSHAPSADADRRYLTAALALLGAFLIVEVVLGILANSLALLSDAAHMLTDVTALALALFALSAARRPAQGGYTFGFKRAEILSAQFNGVTLLVLGGWLGFEGVQRLIDPPEVEGGIVLAVAVAGVGVNLVATWLLSRADRRSLNVEGAFQHILTDLFAFIGTAVAGFVVLVTGYMRADALAALLVAAVMLRSGARLVHASGRVLLEAAPTGLNPTAVAATMLAVPGVRSVHDLHVWEVTSGFPSLSAHVLVASHADCHEIRSVLETNLGRDYGIEHTTLQVDHVGDACCNDDC